jgi:hypothetical protein
VNSSASNSSGASPQNPSPDLTNSGNPNNANSSSTPPVIAINGANPATIPVGASYTDLGATITGPQADLNLGLKYFLNGALVSNIVLDTSQVATDTIDYVATDPTGLAATSTRTILIETPTPPLVPASRCGFVPLDDCFNHAPITPRDRNNSSENGHSFSGQLLCPSSCLPAGTADSHATISLPTLDPAPHSPPTTRDDHAITPLRDGR